ncbi:hypothetical protein AB0I53_28355 [Saccharopolyspora sp. NPDC050389]|uniref:hypothetical protein n=1 Tax=Saccharopolyspora sp. NPDC050389 TaxID=3155516 RepID=UPI0033F22A41
MLSTLLDVRVAVVDAEALCRGKRALVEKLTTSVSDASRLVEIVAEQQVQLVVGHTFEYNADRAPAALGTASARLHPAPALVGRPVALRRSPVRPLRIGLRATRPRRPHPGGRHRRHLGDPVPADDRRAPRPRLGPAPRDGHPVDALWQTGANPVLGGALLNRCFY